MVPVRADCEFLEKRIGTYDDVNNAHPALDIRVAISGMNTSFTPIHPHTDHSLFEASDDADLGWVESGYDYARRADPSQFVAYARVLLVIGVHCFSTPVAKESIEPRLISQS
jgi:hypothetical protein